jgi:transaldolase
MDENKLKEFTKKRTKLIGSLMSSMQSQIAENQRKVYERILDKFIDKLEKDEDGNVKNNDHNRRLLNEIDEVFKEYNKKEGRQTIELLLQSVTSIMSFNQGYFQALDGNARTLKIMPKVKDFMKGWLGIKGDVVEPNGYLDKLIANDPAKIAVKNTAMKVVIGQEGFENAKKQFQTLIDGNKDTLGAFEKHQRNFAFDLYSQIDRATSDVIRNDLGFEFAVYEGGIIESSRIFCEEHDGKIYHISEIKKFNPKEAKPPNYNPITDLGGFGCRHHLNYISTALAKAMGKDVENFEKQTKKTEEKTTKKEEPKTEVKKEKTLSESEKQAIEDYVSGDGMWVNSWLRKKQFDLNKDEKNYIDKLDKATSNPLNEETTLFRSVDAKAIFGDLESSEFESLKSVLIYDSKQSFDVKIANKILEKINIGDTKTEKGFMSSTRSEKIASEWGGFSGSEMPIIMKMQTSKDTRGIDLSNHKMEQEEVLLKRNQQYEIGKIYSKNGNIFVDVKLL